MTRRKPAVLTLAFVGVLVLAACGGDVSDGSSTSSPSSAAATTSPGAATTAASTPDGSTATTATTGTSSESTAPAAPADTDATLRLGFSAAPSQWDPIRGGGGSVAAAYMSPVYDRLLKLDPDGSIQPMLASSYNTSADGLTLTLKLHEGVQFQDGTPFDATAVKANLDRARTDEKSIAKAQLSPISEVDVTDPSTVAIHLSAADAVFPLVFTSPQAGMMVSPTALAHPDSLATTPVGTGPYKLDQSLQDRAQYSRVDGYWDTEVAARLPAKLEVINLADDNARINALQSGQIDAMTVTNPLPEVDQLAESGDYKLYSFDRTTRAIHFQLNIAKPPLDNPDVRRAISMAIDRPTITSTLVNNACIPSVQPFGEGIVGYVADKADAATSTYDPDAAKQLLAAAGVSDLTIHANVIANPLYENIATAVQAQLDQIGVTLDLTKLEAAQMLPEWRKGDTEATFMVTTPQADPEFTIDQIFLGIDSPGGAPQELKNLAATAAQQTLGSPERAKAYEDISIYLAENPEQITLCIFPTRFLASTAVQGMGTMSYDGLGFYDATSLYLAKK